MTKYMISLHHEKLEAKGWPVGEHRFGHRMARSDRWKLILSDAGKEFLFDQQDDPFELTNRRADPDLAPVLNQLRKGLSEWMKSTGERPYPADR